MIEESGEVAGGSSSKESIIKRMDEWKMRESSGDTIYEEVLQGLIPLPEEKESIASSFSLRKFSFLSNLLSSKLLLNLYSVYSFNNAWTGKITTKSLSSTFIYFKTISNSNE